MTNGKVFIEGLGQEDKRVDVAMELAQAINNITGLLKTMEAPATNVHINGCNFQTVEGETAIHLSSVKGGMITNNIVTTSRSEQGTYFKTAYDSTWVGKDCEEPCEEVEESEEQDECEDSCCDVKDNECEDWDD